MRLQRGKHFYRFNTTFHKTKSRKLIVIRHLEFNKLQVDKKCINASRSQVYRNTC